ncbi:MAG: hypothetical protein JNK73_15370, partial [Bacteroidia bacterium]|nr:hypothetical protein [Bacteroidia bacterium]
ACCNVTSPGSISGSTTSCGSLCNLTFGSNAPASGGIGTVQYLWIRNSQPNYPNTGNNGWVAIPNSNSPTIAVGCVTATTYYIRCSRNSGCSQFIGESNMLSVIINNTPSLTISTSSLLCNGGSATATVSASGGTAPYTGTGIFTLNAGPYSYTVTDANGCSASANGNITQASALTVSSSNGTINCYGGTTTVNISANGGTAPYTGTGTYTLSAGSYSFVVTDANGCSSNINGNITQPSVLSASAVNGNIHCNGGTTTVNVTANGGTSPYTGTGNFTVNAGPYSFTVTDSKGCASIANGNITQASALTVSSSNGTINCYGGTTTINISANGGTAPYTGTGTFTRTAGVHSFTVSDSQGCTALITKTLSQPSQLTASAISGTIACGGTTTVNISASGGTAPYTGVGIYTVIAGPYTFTVSDAGACTAVVNGIITQPSALAASAINGSITCNGGNTSVTVTATGGTPPYTGTGTFTRNAGPYTFTVSDANGCSTNVNGNISQPSALSASAVNGTINCNGGTTTVNVSANGGTAPYTGTGTYTLSAGTYSFIVTDANGCSSNINGNITQPSVLSASAVNGNINCNGGTTTVNVSANGGTAPYTGIGNFTVNAGPYSFTVTDSKGCSAIASGSISQPSALNVSALHGTINCNGGTTTINISANGGTAPYTGTGTYTLSAGSYSFVVTDANGCSSNVNGNIAQPSVLSASAVNGNINCNGGTTTVNVTANGGTAPYTGTGNFTVNAGPYSFTVTDSKGCSAIASGSISQPSALTVSSSNGTINCYGGTTTINISANGGTAPYTGTGTFTRTAGVHSFTVSDSQGCTALITKTLSQPSQLTASAISGTIACGGTTTVNISASGGTAPYTGVGIYTVIAGPYTFTVSDAGACTAVVNGIITQPSALSASAISGSISCNGGNTSVTVTATGGTPPYTGTGTFTRTAGPYTFTVSDANGCSTNVNGNISQPSVLSASAVNGTIHCNGGTTTVNVSANGGTAPYTGTGTYTLSAGTYSFIVTDANGCSSNVNGNIAQPSVLSASAINGNINCNGGTTTVNVTANGGTAPYTGIGNFTLNAGPYSFTVTDSKGCSAIASGSISQPTALNVSALHGTINCNGGTTTINISANGGTSPYTGTGIFTVSAGSYSFVVTDANGCSSNVNGNIAQPSVLSASAVNGNINCNGGTTTVNVTANGGTSPYTGTGNFTVNAGPYSFTVTDANGCSSNVNGNITQPAALTASSNNGTINCYGGTTTINISANGGTAPYTGTGNYSVSAGSYSFVVTDANGCTSNVNGNITQPSVLGASAVNGSINCNAGTTTVNVSATGGTAPYTGTGNFTLSAGPFTYTVSDANGCLAIASGSVSQPSALSITALNGTINCNGGSTTVNISAFGGTAPYTGTGSFSVNAGPFSYTVSDANGCSAIANGIISEPSALIVSSNNGTINCNAGTTTVNVSVTGGTAPYTGTGNFTVSAGPFTYTVNDANGCFAIASGSISQPAPLNSSVLSGNINCNGGTTTLNISATGGTAPYTGTGIFTLNAGPYTYSVTDANSCSSIASGTISQPGALTASSIQGTINCNGGTTTVSISANGGTAPYTGTGNFTVNAGPFSYTVSDANACISIASGTITQPNALSASSIQGTINCNAGTTTVNVSAIGGTAPYTGTGNFTVNAGPFTYTVNDANGCFAIASGSISQPAPLNSSVLSGNINCNGGTTTLNISATGGTAPYTGTGIFTVNAGPYSYTVTDANSCSSIASGTISQPGALSASSIQGTINCNGGTTTVNVSATGGTAPYNGTGNFTVSAGPFTYTVNDANGCFAIAGGTITQPGALSASSIQGTINCNAGTTSVTVSANGGTAPYTGTGNFTVNAGPYSFTVTDANGCSSIAGGTISQPSALSATSNNGTINCYGGTTTINISANGGTAPYTGTGNFTLTAGPYSYTVTDANACTSIISGNINEPAALGVSLSYGSILCNGETTTLTVSASGGTFPYAGTGTYTVSAGTQTITVLDVMGCSASTVVSITQPNALNLNYSAGTILCNGGTTSATISASGGTAPYGGVGVFNVSAGTQTLTVIDAQGCTASSVVTILQPSPLVLNFVSGTISCHGGTTPATLSASGGSAPYFGTGVFIVSAGAQTLTVIDAQGCTTSSAINITEPSPLVLNFSAGNILCNGGSTSATISASGGTSPYGGTGVFVVSAGAQTLTVIDAQGCTTSTAVNITQPSPLTLTFAHDSISCHGASANATISASGGTAPYGGTGVFNIFAGTQTLTVIDAQGCTSNSVVNINQPAALSINFAADSILCNGGSASATITASGGTSPYGGTGTYTLSAGVQTLVVIDAQGCITSSAIALTEPAPIAISVLADSILCNGGSAYVLVNAIGGVAPYNGTGLFLESSGIHTYTVSDANGCINSSVINLTEPTLLVGTFLADSILCNGGSASTTISASGGTAPYSGTGVYILTPGFYSYQVADNNGCIVNVSRYITEPSALVATFFEDSIRCFGGYATIVVGASGGTTPYTGVGTFTAFAGNHNYIVTDSNGCSTSTILTITQPPQLVATSIVNTSILCHGDSASVTVIALGGSGSYLNMVTDSMPCMNDSLRAMLAANGGTVPYWGPDTYKVPAGTYTYGVVDSRCCWDTAQITISEPPPLFAGSILGDIACNNNPTSFTITATGGTSPYAGTGVQSMPAGSYTYQVFDANNCQDTTVVIIDTTFCTGFEETNLAEHSIMVYPNPNNGSFRISGLYKGKGQILSQSGQFIREIEFRENEEIIIENMAKGLYFLVTPELRMKIVVLSD